MDILEGIEKEKAEAIKEHFTSLIEAEKNKGIESRREANNEAAGVRSRLKMVESAILEAGFAIPEIEKDGKKTYDYESLSTVLKSTADKTKKLPETETEVSNLRNTVKEYEKTLKELTGFKEKYEETTQKVRKKTLETELSKAFDDDSGNPAIFGKSEVIKNLIYEGVVDLDENEQVIWKIGEEMLDLKTGKEKFLEQRKDLIKVSPKSGSGGSGSGGSQKSGLEALREKNLRLLKGY